jgi:hypothetical protein
LESERARDETQSASVLPPVAAEWDPDAVDLDEDPSCPQSRSDSSRSITKSAVEHGHLAARRDLAKRSRVGERAAFDPSPNLEVLLAQALRLAAVAGRWEIVAQLAREIETRRTIASTNAHVGRQAKRAQDCRSISQNSTTKEEEREG